MIFKVGLGLCLLSLVASQDLKYNIQVKGGSFLVARNGIIRANANERKDYASTFWIDQENQLRLDVSATESAKVMLLEGSENLVYVNPARLRVNPYLVWTVEQSKLSPSLNSHDVLSVLSCGNDHRIKIGHIQEKENTNCSVVSLELTDMDGA